jgi:hypothetical protein
MTFEKDIKPLFRESDRVEMRWALDLWSYEDVKANSREVLERVKSGEMPCDDPWSKVMIERFGAWIDAGMPA